MKKQTLIFGLSTILFPFLATAGSQCDLYLHQDLGVTSPSTMVAKDIQSNLAAKNYRLGSLTEVSKQVSILLGSSSEIRSLREVINQISSAHSVLQRIDGQLISNSTVGFNVHRSSRDDSQFEFTIAQKGSKSAVTGYVDNVQFPEALAFNEEEKEILKMARAVLDSKTQALVGIEHQITKKVTDSQMTYGVFNQSQGGKVFSLHLKDQGAQAIVRELSQGTDGLKWRVISEKSQKPNEEDLLNSSLRQAIEQLPTCK